MSNTENIKLDNIQRSIYTIRGEQVMLDRDLAHFYNVKTIRLREQVKRNPKRFPDDFMFQLNENEVEVMVSQNAIPSKQSLGGSLPYAFTEQGVAAISAVLTSDRAIEINIMIMRAFVNMRHFLVSNAQVFHRLDIIELKQLDTDKKLEMVLDAFHRNQIHPKEGIFFDGQVFDAYKFVCDLVRMAKRSIVLIDNFVDDSVLEILSKRNENVSARIYTKSISKQFELDVEKHNKQYAEIEINVFEKSHDRFLIIDENVVYHIGASLKDIGKKWFAFSKMGMDAFELINKLDG